MKKRKITAQFIPIAHANNFWKTQRFLQIRFEPALEQIDPLIKLFCQTAFSGFENPLHGQPLKTTDALTFNALRLEGVVRELALGTNARPNNRLLIGRHGDRQVSSRFFY